MNKNEFIVVTKAESGIKRYLNINHIVYYYRWNFRTIIKLSTDKKIEVKESCDEIDDMIDEAVNK